MAVTAWTQLATCGKYEGAATLDLIRAFRDIYRGQGPEGHSRLPSEQLDLVVAARGGEVLAGISGFVTLDRRNVTA